MFDDIVICEILHKDPDEEEGCNPHQIIVGNSNTEGILVTMLFKEDDRKSAMSPRFRDLGIDIFAEVIDNDKTEYQDKYDVQTAVEFTITNKNEKYKMLIGSNGEHFHYFTNVPAINNTTDFGNTIFLSFPHTVEGFTYKDTNYKTFQ